MVFKPFPSDTRWEGLAVSVWILLIDLLLLIWQARRGVDWLKFALILIVLASLPLLYHVVRRTWAAFSLEYWIDRNAVTIRWADSHKVIPLNSIQRVISHGVSDLTQPTWWDWPAQYVRQGHAQGLVDVMSAATRPLEECLLLDTGEEVVALSPQDRDGFLAALQARYRLGPVRNVAPASEDRLMAWTRLVGRDLGSTILLSAGFIGVLVLFGLLMIRFPNLPDALAFHYNGQGLPDVVRGKNALFVLPGIGFLAWLINGLWGLWMAYQKQRTGAYMLWGGTLIVQLCSFFALISLVS